MPLRIPPRCRAVEIFDNSEIECESDWGEFSLDAEVMTVSAVSTEEFGKVMALSLGRVFPVSVLCQLQALFRVPKNLVFRRPADVRASRRQDVQSLELQSACNSAVQHDHCRNHEVLVEGLAAAAFADCLHGRVEQFK